MENRRCSSLARCDRLLPPVGRPATDRLRDDGDAREFGRAAGSADEVYAQRPTRTSARTRSRGDLMPGIVAKGEMTSGPPLFTEPDQPCPVSDLHAVLKQVSRAELTPAQNSFLDAAFSGFFEGVEPPGAFSKDLAEHFDSEYEDRVPRRYDGDQTLPPGRYSTVCVDSSGNDGGTLAREMRFYMSAQVAEGLLEVYDGTVPADDDMIARLGLAAQNPRIVLRYKPFAQPEDRDDPLGVLTGAELEIREVRVPNVLDLRRTSAATWLCRTISRLSVMASDGTPFRCFPNRDNLDVAADLWPSLMDQARGGGNLCKIVGLYLRSLGVSGLVFPSARSDVRVKVVDGVSVDQHGWSFVDYRDAPEAQLIGFFEMRPRWPSSLTIEGGDDNTPRPPAFAREVTFADGGYSFGNGFMVVEGLEQRLWARYLAESAEAAVLHRLEGVDAEQVQELIAFLVSLSARDAAAVSSMVLSSLLGYRPAQLDLAAAAESRIGEHPVSGLLRACCSPPRSTREDAARARGWMALFGASPEAGSERRG